MVLTKTNITFVIDEEEPCIYTMEGTTSKSPYDNIEIVLRRTTKTRQEVKEICGGKKGGEKIKWLG
jgi:hypothetical protein